MEKVNFYWGDLSDDTNSNFCDLIISFKTNSNKIVNFYCLLKNKPIKFNSENKTIQAMYNNHWYNQHQELKNSWENNVKQNKLNNNFLILISDVVENPEKSYNSKNWDINILVCENKNIGNLIQYFIKSYN